MQRRQALKLFAGLALCPLCASTGFASEGHWSYEGATGPEKWGGLDAADAACSAGGQQSPIDITATISARQPLLRISWSKRPDTIVNNGHTIQLDFAEGDTLQMGDRRYALKQFHFHHPSEHLVEGKRFAMEVHFVHAGTDGLVVIAALMVAGKPNTIFKKNCLNNATGRRLACPGRSCHPSQRAIAGTAYVLPLRGIAHYTAVQ